MIRRICLLMACSLPLLCACATRAGSDGRQETHFHPRYLAKTEIDRVIDTTRAEIFSSLKRIAEKLYRRNPREWKKAAQASRESVLQDIHATLKIHSQRPIYFFIFKNFCVKLYSHESTFSLNFGSGSEFYNVEISCNPILSLVLNFKTHLIK